MATAVASSTTNSASADIYTALNGSSSSTSSTTSSEGADRFLKLLVTQMQNQDPLNPLDNAEVTSQMAQISTVTGLEKVNSSVSTLNTQFLQMQTLQGAALVGSEVTVKGNSLYVQDGVGVGAFELAATAGNVKLEILDASGRVAGTEQLGAAEAGRHSFAWDASGVADTTGYTFRITATSGSTNISSTALMLDQVGSVGLKGGVLTLDLLRSGEKSYADIVAFN
jgi:flagellar basal-body rod modification protein FlgD